MENQTLNGISHSENLAKLEKIGKAYDTLEEFYLNGADDLEASIYSIMGTYTHPKSEEAHQLIEQLREITSDIITVAQIQAKEISKTLNN